MGESALAGQDVGEVPVVVPLNEVDPVFGKDGGEASVDVIGDFGFGEIEDQLIAAQGRLQPVDLYRPIGVGPIKVAVGGNGLRLEPKAEFHAVSMDVIRKPFDQVGQFLFANLIIAQGAMVIIALPKPAVIEDEKLDAEFAGFLYQGMEFGLVEIEVGAFPVIEDDGPFRVLVGDRQNAAPDEGMEGGGHLRFVFSIAKSEVIYSSVKNLLSLYVVFNIIVRPSSTESSLNQRL